MLKLKLQSFGHLMSTASSLEKILMLGKMEGLEKILILGKMEGKRRRRMR